MGGGGVIFFKRPVNLRVSLSYFVVLDVVLDKLDYQERWGTK